MFLFTYQLEVDGSLLWYQLLSQSYVPLSELDENRGLAVTEASRLIPGEGSKIIYTPEPDSNGNPTVQTQDSIPQQQEPASEIPETRPVADAAVAQKRSEDNAVFWRCADSSAY